MTVQEVIEQAEDFISIPEIALLTNLSPRKVRDKVSKLRSLGIAVYSTHNQSGYRMARNKSEVKEVIRDLRGRANVMETTANILEKKNL